MGIRLFFRHLFNSINRRKAQPFLLVFVIACAVVVSISTINLKTYTIENVEQQNRAVYGTTDIVVSVNSLSPRFSFVDGAKRQFGDKANICGVFTLPVFYGENNDFLYGIATDFTDICKIFDFKFIQYSYASTDSAASLVFLSQTASEQYGFHLGDTLTFNIMGNVLRYEVAGISANRFLDTYDIMVDTSSLMEAIFDDSLIVQMLFADADFAGQLYFDLLVDDPNFYTELREYYYDMTVTDVAMLEGVTYGLDEIIFLMILAILFFVMCVIYFCCYILATQRVEDTYLFYCVGAKSYMLNALSFCELALYWFLGSVIGIAASYPTGQLIIDACKLTYSTNVLSPSTVIISVVLLFFATEGSLILYILSDLFMKKQRRKEKKKQLKKRNAEPILLLLLWVTVFTLLVLSFFVNKTFKWYLGLSDFFFFILAVAMTSKHTCAKLPRLFFKNKRFDVTTRYAFKNIQKTTTLSNLTVLMGTLTISIACIVLMIMCFSVSMEQCRTLIKGDYMVMYAPDTSIEALRNSDKVSSVESLYREQSPMPEVGVRRYDIYSATDSSLFQGLFHLDELPQKNEAYVFGLFAERIGVEIGETFTIRIGDKTFELVYAKSLPVNTNGIVVNSEYLGLPYNYTIVQAKEGVSDEELYDEMQSILSHEGALVLNVNQINDFFIDSNSYSYYCCLFLLIVVLLFSAIGIMDNIASSYRSRREQFTCYALAGMSKQNLRKMKGTELATTIFCGIIIGLIVVPLAYTIIYECALGQGINLLWLFGA